MKKFFTKYWYIVLGTCIALVLLTQRGFVLRRISALRAKLLASQRSLVEIETAQKVAQGEAQLTVLNEQATAARREIAETHTAIDELHREYAVTTESINAARSWEDLERLRTKGNQR